MKLKKILAYILLPFWAIRASYLQAYRATKETGKFTYKVKAPEFFKTKIKAVADANRKATATGTVWHVIEPETDKFVAVSEKMLNGAGLKSLYQSV